MPYTVCLTKVSPCCVIPYTAVGSAPKLMRTLEVYGCSPDLTVGEKAENCCQGTTTPTGSCCGWTVPAGVTSITVELWGGGGGGPSGSTANCCGTNPGGGAGTYVKRTITVAPGDLMTFCAGSGGCSGGGSSSTNSWCCCGQPGNCSYVLRNGNFCADSWGGQYGISECYYYCGCIWQGCGTSYSTCGTYGNNGNNIYCSSYTVDMAAGPTTSMVPGCTGYCTAQFSQAAGATFGGGESWWGYTPWCWQYIRFNTSCTNTAGIAGPGGDSGPTGQAYNTPGSSQYAQASTDFSSCERARAAPPGNFPGGGGPSGFTSACCFRHTTGGLGAPGYIRVFY